MNKGLEHFNKELGHNFIKYDLGYEYHDVFICDKCHSQLFYNIIMHFFTFSPKMQDLTCSEVCIRSIIE